MTPGEPVTDIEIVDRVFDNQIAGELGVVVPTGEAPLLAAATFAPRAGLGGRAVALRLDNERLADQTTLVNLVHDVLHMRRVA